MWRQIETVSVVISDGNGWSNAAAVARFHVAGMLHCSQLLGGKPRRKEQDVMGVVIDETDVVCNVSGTAGNMAQD